MPMDKNETVPSGNNSYK